MMMRRMLHGTRWMAVVLGLLAGVLVAVADQLPNNPPPPAGAAPAGVDKVLQPPHQKAALIPLYGEVDDVMRKSIERRVDIARKAGCTLIIYDIDTYGGMLTSGLEISKLTKKLPAENINTVAWVHDKAYSAGVFVATSCQQIVMTSQGSMGACVPIAVSPITNELIPMSAAEQAKANSPVLQELENSAQRNHLSKSLLWAMVVPEIEIHRLRNRTTGEVRYVDTVEKDKLLAEQVDLPGGGKGPGPWRFEATVDGKGQVLTVGADLALDMGLSKATIDSEAQLRAKLNIVGDLMVLDFDWAELATRWLTQSWVRFLLIVGMIVMAIMEFSHPGTTVPGIIAILCLLLLVGAPYLTGLAQIWEIILILLGVGIIAADLFAFGGIGYLAIPGFILMVIGLVASFVPAEPGGGWIPTMPSTWIALRTGLTVVALASIVSLATFMVLSRYLYMAPGFRRLQLAPASGAAPEVPVLDTAARPAGEAVFPGALGLAATDLRPAGKVRFDQHLVNVVSYGSFIPRGVEVEVVKVDGYRITVRPRRPAARDPNAAPNTALDSGPGENSTPPPPNAPPPDGGQA